jgi:hypothetical protein
MDEHGQRSCRYYFVRRQQVGAAGLLPWVMENSGSGTTPLFFSIFVYLFLSSFHYFLKPIKREQESEQQILLLA